MCQLWWSVSGKPRLRRPAQNMSESKINPQHNLMKAADWSLILKAYVIYCSLMSNQQVYSVAVHVPGLSDVGAVLYWQQDVTISIQAPIKYPWLTLTDSRSVCTNCANRVAVTRADVAETRTAVCLVLHGDIFILLTFRVLSEHGGSFSCPAVSLTFEFSCFTLNPLHFPASCH